MIKWLDELMEDVFVVYNLNERDGVLLCSEDARRRD